VLAVNKRLATVCTTFHLTTDPVFIPSEGCLNSESKGRHGFFMNSLIRKGGIPEHK